MRARLTSGVFFLLAITVALMILVAAPAVARQAEGPPSRLSKTGVALDGSLSAPGPVAARRELAGEHASTHRDPSELPTEVMIDHSQVMEWVDDVLSNRTYQEDEEENPFAPIDLCVSEEMSDTNTPGASIAIALDGVITYTHGYGVKHIADGGVIDNETMFRFGSTLKMMTAAAVMQLVEAGKVDLDAPITDYIPSFRIASPWLASDITAHHLLTHSSGFPDRTFTLDTNTTLEKWGETQGDVWLNAAPGSFWNYSNPNFALAGLVVQEVTGIPYADYMRARVWEPAGMTLTTLDSKQVMDHGNYAWGHEAGEAAYDPRSYGTTTSWVAPAGLGFSTPTELVTWTLQLSAGGGDFLSPDSAASLQSAQQTMDRYPWASYGYGIVVENYQDVADHNQQVTVLSHGGNAPGWSSQLYWVPERGFAVSILANTITSLAGSAHCALKELAAVEPILPYDQTTEPDSWSKYTGTYSMVDVLGVPWTAQVTLDDQELNYEETDAWLLGTQLPFQQLYYDTFYLSGTDFDATFIGQSPDGEHSRWLRNRLVVGERVGEFPGSVSIQGQECAPIPITAGMDVDRLETRAYGPSRPIVRTGLPIQQDAFRRPDTASFKMDVDLSSSAGLLTAFVNGEDDDDLDLYVLFDADIDGEFRYPYEVLWPNEHTVNRTSHEAIIIPGSQPAGHYQVWVHGYDVEGEDSKFDLGVLAISNPNLSLSDVPISLEAGQTYEPTVCATGRARGSEPLVGLVEMLYGSPPRRVAVMVDWQPPPGTELFLPLTIDGWAFP